MRDLQLDQLWRLILVAIPYALIYSIPVSNGLILCLLLASLIYAFRKRINPFTGLGPFFFISVPFWITVWGLSYSINVQVGASILETRLPLVLFPIIFFLRSPSSADVTALLKHFLLSIAATFFIVFSIAVYKNFKDPWSEVWFNKWYYHYDNLTEPIDIQPLYLSLFVSLGLLLVLLNHLDIKFDVIKNKRLRLALLLIFIVFLVLLGVRSILIITVLLIILLFVKNRFFSKRKSLIFVTLLIASLIGLSLLSPVTSERFEGLLKGQYNFSKYSVDRFIIWSVALKHITGEPVQFFFGKGTGSSEQIMDGLYKAQGIVWDFEKKTNTHNQYIEFVLDTGFLGVAVFIFFLLLLLVRFHSSQNRIGEIFVLMMSLALVSENYLNRQKGVVFFSLFLCLFFFWKGKLDTQTKKTEPDD